MISGIFHLIKSQIKHLKDIIWRFNHSRMKRSFWHLFNINQQKKRHRVSTTASQLLLNV